jgi:hypothetical protein
MADIPLKSDDEMTNDLVNAVENIAQSVKAGSRDFTKSFNGLTTAIKKLQTTLVNAIKAIKIQVVTKPEKTQKSPIKEKSTSTKEIVKEKETKTEVAPEKKVKPTKIEAEKIDVPKQPKPPKVVDPIAAAEAERKKKRSDESAELLLQTRRLKAQLAALQLQNALNPSSKEPKKEPKKTVDPQEKERLAQEKKRAKEIDARQEKVKPVKISSLIEGINQTGDAWSRMISGVKKTIVDIDNARKEEEKQVAKTGKEGTKEFVGPPQKLFINQQNKEKEEKDKYEKEVQERQRKVKPVNISSLVTGINQIGDAWSKVISNVKNAVEQQAKIKAEEEKKVIESGNEKSKKFVGPLKKDFEENERKKVLPNGPEFVGPPKQLFETDQIRQKNEEEVKKLGKEGTKAFVGPPKKLFEGNEKSIADASAKAIIDAADQAAADAKAALERKNKAEEEAAKAEKTLREYFRKKEEKEAQESAKAANDFIKQQEQAVRQLEQANQRTQKELDSLIAGFQRLTPLFKGPLVNFGLRMIAKGIGFKQPKPMSKGGDVSYLADGGDASNPMKPNGTDTQPAMLTPGEFVVNKKAAQDPDNRRQLEAINSGKNKKKVEYHSSGGSVGGVGYYAAGGPVMAAAGVAIAAVGAAINSVTQSFAIASEAVSKFANAVQKANPALMEQVGLAMDDLQAVIGRALSPAIAMVVPLIRDFADYVDYSAKKFAPAFEAVIRILKELMKPLLELGVTTSNALVPIVKVTVLILGGLVKILIPVIDLFSSLFETFTLLVGSFGDAEFLLGVFNQSVEILSRAVSIVAGTIQLVIGAFVVGVSKMIEVLGAMVDYIPFSGDAGKSIEGFGERVGKVGEKLYNKSLENFRAVGEGKPKRFRAGEMSGEDGIQKGSSYGAAVRQVQSFSIAGIGDEMRKNALMAGLNQKTQEEHLNQIERNTGQLVDLFKDLKLPQTTGSGGIVGPNPYAPTTVNPNYAVPGNKFGAIVPMVN